MDNETTHPDYATQRQEAIDLMHAQVQHERADADVKFRLLFERVAYRHKNMVLSMYQAFKCERIWVDRELDGMRRALAHAEEMLTMYKQSNAMMKQTLESMNIDPADVITNAAARH